MTTNPPTETVSEIYCRCGWMGYRTDLIPDSDIEHMHPANRGRVFQNEPLPPDVHITKAEKCPKCGRWLFADDKPTGLDIEPPNPPTEPTVEKWEIDFGDTVTIEQKRFGVPNEHYGHKVIGRLKSNAYVDVPVQSPAKETIHKESVDVVRCVCIGVSETEVLKYRLSDVKLVHSLVQEAKAEERSRIVGVVRNMKKDENLIEDVEIFDPILKVNRTIKKLKYKKYNQALDDLLASLKQEKEVLVGIDMEKASADLDKELTKLKQGGL